MSDAIFRGTGPALVTPFDADGEVDLATFSDLVERQIAGGVHFLVPCGTTGESATLTATEQATVIRRTVEVAAGRIPVLAGAGSNATRTAVAFSRAAAEAGADGVLVVTPYYNKPSRDGLALHYAAVAEVGLPIVLYNVPGRTACDMVPETVARLVAVANIIGIKEATGDVSRVTRIRELCGPDFAIYSGEDGNALEAMLAGAQGVISVTANAAPAPMHEMCRLALAGDETAARGLDARLRPLHDALFLESNPIPVKWAVAELGLMPAGIRLPLTPLSEQFHDSVRGALRHAGMLD